MSTIDRWGRKVVLTRIGPDEFWRDVHAHYAAADPLKWKSLAMLALRVNDGWSLDMIGNAFRHDRGHVSRALKELCRELQETFQWSPEIEDSGARRSVFGFVPSPPSGREGQGEGGDESRTSIFTNPKRKRGR